MTQQSVKLKLRQTQQLNQKQQQSLRILHMSSLELAEEVESWLADNPLLERPEHDPADSGEPEPHYSAAIPVTRKTNSMEESDVWETVADEADFRRMLHEQVCEHPLDEDQAARVHLLIDYLDDQGYLKACNSSAGHILMLDLAACRETSVHEWHKLGVAEALAAQVLLAILSTIDSDKPVQLTYAAPDESRILLGKATRLPEDNGAGTVLVFDDVTALVQAQKEAAWGEVAQRLAHEIRNPLTPIQLSAERLAWKLDGKLDDKDAAMLERATNTIVNQVAAMKDMVEAFRNYAKAPKLKLERIDLNILAAELLVLYEGSNCTFEADFSNIEAVVEADAGAMRQVLHNILKNGAEAAAADEQPKVFIQTAVQDDKVLLNICNNGKSFSEDMLLHAFDPYVTDKPGGTGLGLPVVKKIIEEHKGRISLANRPEGGACVKITLPLLMENDAQQ